MHVEYRIQKQPLSVLEHEELSLVAYRKLTNTYPRNVIENTRCKTWDRNQQSYHNVVSQQHQYWKKEWIVTDTVDHHCNLWQRTVARTALVASSCTRVMSIRWILPQRSPPHEGAEGPIALFVETPCSLSEVRRYHQDLIGILPNS